MNRKHPDPMHARKHAAIALAIIAAAQWGAFAHAEEIRLYDERREYGLVQDISADGQLRVLRATGDEVQLSLEEVVTIRFLGRSPLLVQSGTQEFRFVDGSRLRGQILANQGDLVRVETAMAGVIDLNLAHLKGFVAMPLAGFSGRKAEELVESPPGRVSPSVDVVLDRRGSTYRGVVRRLERTTLALDHEDLLQVVPVRMLYLAGVRLADAAQSPRPDWEGDVQLRLTGRDGSVIQGRPETVRLGKWTLRPFWDPETSLSIDVNEISLVQVLGGRVQYLSQLEPVEVVEQTVLAPPQPHRMDRSCRGDALSIAGKRYPWGIGVHADSALSFRLGGRFAQFKSDIGVASQMGDRGSVVFSISGDGKSLYTSEVIRGSDPRPLEVSVPVTGIDVITLKVESAGDLDLGDVANWGSARVMR